MTTLVLWHPNWSTGTLCGRAGTLDVELGGFADGWKRGHRRRRRAHLAQPSSGVIGRATVLDAAPGRSTMSLLASTSRAHPLDQGCQLGVEPVGLLEVGYVADAVVPRHLGRGAGGQ